MQETLNSRRTFRCWCMVKLKKALPIQYNHRKNRTKLNDESKGFDKLSAFYSQKVLGNNHVSC